MDIPYTVHCLHIFFFNDTATTEIYTLSLHDALPIYAQSKPPATAGHVHRVHRHVVGQVDGLHGARKCEPTDLTAGQRSEEHTSELQSRQYLVCRLLLEKKK